MFHIEMLGRILTAISPGKSGQALNGCPLYPDGRSLSPVEIGALVRLKTETWDTSHYSSIQINLK